MGPGERTAAQAQVRALAEQGLRVDRHRLPAVVGRRRMSSTPSDEADLIFEGICAFADPPKATCTGAIARLAAAGIRVKILSGDDPVVVKRLAGLVGLAFRDRAVGIRHRRAERRGARRPGPDGRCLSAGSRRIRSRG